MINLLPTDMKRGYFFARRNSHLIRWLMASVLVIIGAAAITTAGWLYLDQTGKQYDSQIKASRKNLELQDYAKVQKQVQEISNNLKLSEQVLSKQILFSDLLTHLGSIMPKDTKLSTLTISQEQSGIDMSASAKTYNSATQIQVNLMNSSNKLFSKVDLISINCSEVDVVGYPCKVTLRALFSSDNPFLFSNNKSGADTR